MTIEAFRTWFHPFLTQITHEFIAQAKYIPDRDLQSLIEHTEKLILSNGKRVRPYLCRVMCQTNNEEMASMYVGFELFHSFCLIHDDVIDHGKLRHGVLTLHEFFRALAEKQRRHGDITNIADAQAILVGDLLINFVFSRVNRHEGTNSRRVKELFYMMANRVVLGQMCDVDSTTRNKVSRRFIETKMQLKTAEYTFIYPLTIGHALTGNEYPAIYTFCHDFGTALGQAFQIQDDLFDILPGKSAQKSTFSDIREGQHTLHSYKVLESVSPAQKKALRHFGRSDDIDSDALLTVFKESGAIAYATGEINSHISKAKELVSNVDLVHETKQELSDLVSYIAKRSH
jgi:geranylgeranyl diphosphate synthase type I